MGVAMAQDYLMSKLNELSEKLDIAESNTLLLLETNSKLLQERSKQEVLIKALQDALMIMTYEVTRYAPQYHPIVHLTPEMRSYIAKYKMAMHTTDGMVFDSVELLLKKEV